MSDTSPTLSLPYIQPSQAQKHVTHNEALRQLDILVQTVVNDRDLTTPPGAPVAGDSHIVAPGGTGLWAGHDTDIASFDGADWQFTTPVTGWQAQVVAENRPVVFDGTNWATQQPDLNNLTGVGIATQADATNRLAVSADATLLSHDGAGHQVKINKSTQTDTASLLFQTGWSGRAEMGTAGNDHFAIKVTSDGAAWNIGLEIDSDTGKTAFPSGVDIDGSVTGTAIQQTPQDITPGRLMRADYGYGPANLLGVVSESGGVPTGAVIERGTTADGTFVRFADGTQICSKPLMLSYLNAGRLTATWTYPASFAAAATADLYLSGMINLSSFNSSVAGPGIADVLDVRFGTITSSSVVAQMYRITGTTNFTTSDSCECRLIAIGRWV